MARDFTQKAITDTLTGKRKWNRDKYPDIFIHLKGVVSSLISNSVTSKENKTSASIDLYDQDQEFILPIVSSFPDPESKLLADDLAERLKKQICEAEDETGMLELVFLAILEKQLTPQEISEDLEIDITAVYNAKRRIKRIFERLLKAENDG